MALTFEVSGRIAHPVHDVFEAVADPDQLSSYFTTNGAKGRLETGATVVWDFADFPGAFPVHVVDVEQDRRIVLRWQAADDSCDPYETTVTLGSSRSTTSARSSRSPRKVGATRTPPDRRHTATAKGGPACCAR
jgi:uncharacterized protein YndB with AHSA1/START domain